MRYLAFVYYGPGINTDPSTGGPVAGCDDYGNPHQGNATGVFWTGIYDDQTGCGSNPRCFPTSVQMQQYATANGLTLMPFNNMAEVLSFCKKWIHATGTTVTGGVGTNITGGGGGTPSPQAVITGVPPGTPGALPSGTTVGQTFQKDTLNAVYRFILQLADGTYGSGANYPGCSKSNSAMCDPQAHHTLNDAIAYAEERQEIAYLVHDKEEPWGIMAGTVPIDSNRLLGSHAPHHSLIGPIIAAVLWYFS